MPNISFKTKDDFVGELQDILRGADIDIATENALLQQARLYVKRAYPDVPDDANEALALQKEKKKVDGKKEWVVLHVNDSQAYVFQTVPAVRRLHTPMDAEWEPEEWGLSEFAARLVQYCQEEVQMNKKIVGADEESKPSLGDILEYGNKKRLKRLGLVLKTKLPAYMVPVADVKIP